MRLNGKLFILLAAFPTPLLAQGAGPPIPPGTDPRFVSQDRVDYDEVGYAAKYGDALNGSLAAHASLPAGSFAEVTDLATGRTILVKIRDRQALEPGKLIALSPQALGQLSMDTTKPLSVRVRRINPPAHERTALSKGAQAAERLATPPALLNALRKKLAATPIAASAQTRVIAPEAAPKSTPQIDSAGARPSATRLKPGGYFVQVAAFRNGTNAKSLAKSVGAKAEQAGNFWRVRAGPFENEAAARTALGAIKAKGYRDAQIVR